jgi:hypothetical protein
MGAATRGGGAVESGAKNRVISETSQTTGPVLMAKGGDAKKKSKGMMAGGMMSKGYAAGGAAKMSKGMMAGGKR